MHDLLIIGLTAVITGLLSQVLCRRERPRRRTVFGFFFWDGKVKGSSMSKIIHMETTGHVATIKFLDNDGEEQPVVGKPVWSVAPDGIVALTVADDGMSATVDPVAEGDATITVVAEADEEVGKNTITLTGDVTVAHEEAVGGSLVIS